MGASTHAAGAGAGTANGSEGGTLLEVGRVVKPHGLRGDVIVSLTTNRPERVDAGSTLRTRDGRELRVVRSSPHQGRYIVTFEGVADIDQAEALRDTELLARPMDDPDALWVHDLIGSRVVDAAGTVLGTVQEVQANPASDLLVLEGGALIPLRFVVANRPGWEVTVDVPDGLLDLS
ncbi:MAG: ribosome maturation factor RimM [Acidimicrobiales bacterium]